MVSTKDINEAGLLYNLKNRLSEEKTITNIAPTLIIVNPFKNIKNIYSHKKITEPYLYDLFLIAIWEIIKPNSKNQSLIISGESGVGKTISNKNSMECITYFFSKFNKNINTNSTETPLEKNIRL